MTRLKSPLQAIEVDRPGGPAFVPPEELSDFSIAMIHAGLLTPNAEAIRSMSREIRAWRREPDPDAV